MVRIPVRQMVRRPNLANLMNGLIGLSIVRFGDWILGDVHLLMGL